MAIWGEVPFCKVTTVLHTIDEITDTVYLPAKAQVLLLWKMQVDEDLPAGDWNVALDVSNGSSTVEKRAARMFCVEGRIMVRNWRTHQFWRGLKSIMLGGVFAKAWSKNL